jgi:hypothetical protein
LHRNKKISALIIIENKAITLVVEETKISFFAFYRPYERCRSSSHKNMQHGGMFYGTFYSPPEVRSMNLNLAIDLAGQCGLLIEKSFIR